MKRRLVAAFACRAGGSRLYAKPLQNLEPGVSILDQLLHGAKSAPEIDEIVLGIAEGEENAVFMKAARTHGLKYIVGSEKDVLFRLIQCGRAGQATDVFRVTTECPFTAWDLLPEAWHRHVSRNNDITVTDWLPEGLNFEIYTLAALERSHTEGEDRERSEYCSAYPRRRPDLFRIEIVEPATTLRRTDLRFTVDNPEDLILCRAAYAAHKNKAPRIAIGDLIAFADAHPELTEPLRPFVDTKPIWAAVLQ